MAKFWKLQGRVVQEIPMNTAFVIVESRSVESPCWLDQVGAIMDYGSLGTLRFNEVDGTRSDSHHGGLDGLPMDYALQVENPFR
jgi:hypothetical protein